MKQLSRIAAAALLVAGGFVSSQAIAGPTCSTVCQYTGNTYVGSYNSAIFDSGSFEHIINTGTDPILPVGTPITDTWFFDVSPANADFGVNASFRNDGAISSFRIDLRAVDLSGLGVCATVGATCGTIPTIAAGVLATSVYSAATQSAAINVGFLATGRYAFQVFGFTTGNAVTRYTGQLDVAPTPEPASLALVGIALLGAAAGLRRGRKA